MPILGISAFYHDSAAALIHDGTIIAAAQEERFTRKKHDSSFPKNAIQFCLEYSGFDLSEIDAVVFYDKPLLKFERLLETYYAFAPRGIRSFIASMPVWLREKMFLKKVLRDELKKIDGLGGKKVKLLFPEHHLSHAASAFYPSTYQEAAILTIDGVGEWATASICYGEGEKIKILKELKFPHSIGLLYSAFTYFLGFRVNSGEYKLMGLAPYGNPESSQVLEFVDAIKNSLCTVFPDGSVWLNQKYFNYATGLTMTNDNLWENIFGFSRRKSTDSLEQHHCNLALAIQHVCEEVVLKMATHAKQLTGSENLCLAGGVALNCVANGKLQNAEIFKNIFIQPAAGDAGGAIGGALVADYLYFGTPRIVKKMDRMRGGYLGPEYSDTDIEKVCRKYKAESQKFANKDELYQLVAKKLDDGKVIGWMQGRMEFGPRALGARSILGDARNPEMQKKLNLKIKYRESFRPFAPAVLDEDANKYFHLRGDSPYMLLVHQISDSIKKSVPDNYHDLDIRDKLYFIRSELPAITHIDYSARIQTVHSETNPNFYSLLKKFKELTGYGVLVNTSFNVRGEPIVCNPDDAYRCFMRTEMDYLVINNFMFRKEDQPEWNEANKWEEEFVLD